MFNFRQVMKQLEMQISRDDIVVLDVRERDEYVAGHIPGCLWIPLGQLEAQASALPHDKVIYVYCRSGQRAQSGVKVLHQLGYEHVENAGGMIHWPGQIETGEQDA